MFKIYKFIQPRRLIFGSNHVRFLGSKKKEKCPKKKGPVCPDPKKRSKCPQRYECKMLKEEDPYDPDCERRKKTHPFFTPKKHKDFKIYRTIFLFVCLPAILALTINGLLAREVKKRPKFLPFEHLRIRNKQYPWDPERTLFHNPRYNALPNGYEFEVPEEEEEDESNANRCCPP